MSRRRCRRDVFIHRQNIEHYERLLKLLEEEKKKKKTHLDGSPESRKRRA